MEMVNVAGKLALACASVGAAVTVLATPAEAAENPFSAAQACSNDFGGSWDRVSDGHRRIQTANDSGNGSAALIVGDVYLMYDPGSGKNCVVTLKRVDIDEETPFSAVLRVQDVDTVRDSDKYKYYAAIEHGARDTCVAYEGSVTYRGRSFDAGRKDWGNCG